MKAAIILLIFFIQVLPASAADSFPEGVAGTAHIAGLFSNLESFDVTLFSDKPYQNLNLELTLLRPAANNEEVLARTTIPVAKLPENTELTKVGSWDLRSSQSGAYSVRASLIENGKVISESKYNFIYGDNSVSKIRVDDLVSDSRGINVMLSPVKPALFDIEFMLVDGNNVVFSTKANSLSLTSFPGNFSAVWGTLLTNNREYQGRVKVRIYSPEEDTFVSTCTFVARDNAEITDIYKDETGASATVYGKSQVPFNGSLGFKVFKLNNDSVGSSSEPLESIQEKVPVLLNGDDETVEVAWKERLQKGIYRLEIELLGNNGEAIEKRETIIESDFSPQSNRSVENFSAAETNTSSGKSTPGFSTVALISGLTAISFIFRKKVNNERNKNVKDSKGKMK